MLISACDPIVIPDLFGNFPQDVLPTEVYCRSIGALTDIALDAMVTEVKQLEDMSSVETQQLRSLFKPLMMNVPTLFDKVGVYLSISGFPSCSGHGETLPFAAVYTISSQDGLIAAAARRGCAHINNCARESVCMLGSYPNPRHDICAFVRSAQSRRRPR